MSAYGQNQPILSQQLLLSVAEELKTPLLQIARQAELASLQDNRAVSLGQIQTTADMALRLIDSYVLGARLALEQEYMLQMEPVSISSVLYDAGQQLDGMAKLYGVELDLNVGGKYGPVMAHRAGLQSALVSLGHALIEAMPALGGGQPHQRLTLSAYRSRYGIVTGVYSDVEQLTTEALRQGKRLKGHARQPLATLTHTSGAGVFVADAILQAMDSGLTVSRHHKLFGLAAILKPNPQLQLI
jgi:hypothetical protein